MSVMHGLVVAERDLSVPLGGRDPILDGIFVDSQDELGSIAAREFYGAPLTADEQAMLQGPIGTLARLLVPSVVTPQAAVAYQEQFEHRDPEVSTVEFIARLVVEGMVECQQKVQTAATLIGNFAVTAIGAVISPVQNLARKIVPQRTPAPVYAARHAADGPAWNRPTLVLNR